MKLESLGHLKFDVLESGSKAAHSVEVATDRDVDCFDIFGESQLTDGIDSGRLSIVSTVNTHQIRVDLFYVLFDDGKQLGWWIGSS